MRQPLSKCLSPTVPLSLSSTTRPRHETPPRHSSPIHKRSGDANARDNVRAATDPFWSVFFQPRTRVPSYFIRIHHFSVPPSTNCRSAKRLRNRDTDESPDRDTCRR
uniref:Uncharacterized protein n=1 Tax=Sipha flava TaxID=143950 RepID=A0A2S2Q2R2_9HEMI